MKVYLVILIAVLISVVCTALLLLLVCRLLIGLNPFSFGRSKLPTYYDLQKKVIKLEERVAALEKALPRNPSQQGKYQTSALPVQAPLQDTVIVPDAAYVRSLRRALKPLEGKLDATYYSMCSRSFQQLIDQNRFDDPEETMAVIHAAIRQCIHESDTRISRVYLEDLRQFLTEAGYRPYPVHEGSELDTYKQLFNSTIPAQGGVPGTIRTLERQPYHLKYSVRGQTKELVLYGKCTFNT